MPRKKIFKVVRAGQQPGVGEQSGTASQDGPNGTDDGSSVLTSGDTDEANGGDSEGGIIAASEEETGRILYHETDGIENGDDDGGVDFDRDYGERYVSAIKHTTV